MSTELGRAYIPIDGDWSRFNRDLAKRRTSLGRTFGGLGATLGKSLGVGIGAAAGAGLAAVVAEGKRAVEAFRESRKVGAPTNAVLKSTGGVVNVTAKEVGDLATAISRKTGVDDEAIQSGENMLLTFTNVRNEVGKNNKIFDRATQLVTDMS